MNRKKRSYDRDIFQDAIDEMIRELDASKTEKRTAHGRLWLKRHSGWKKRIWGLAGTHNKREFDENEALANFEDYVNHSYKKKKSEGEETDQENGDDQEEDEINGEYQEQKRANLLDRILGNDHEIGGSDSHAHREDEKRSEEFLQRTFGDPDFDLDKALLKLLKNSYNKAKREAGKKYEMAKNGANKAKQFYRDFNGLLKSYSWAKRDDDEDNENVNEEDFPLQDESEEAERKRNDADDIFEAIQRKHGNQKHNHDHKVNDFMDFYNEFGKRHSGFKKKRFINLIKKMHDYYKKRSQEEEENESNEEVDNKEHDIRKRSFELPTVLPDAQLKLLPPEAVSYLYFKSQGLPTGMENHKRSVFKQNMQLQNMQNIKRHQMESFWSPKIYRPGTYSIFKRHVAGNSVWQPKFWPQIYRPVSNLAKRGGSSHQEPDSETMRNEIFNGNGLSSLKALKHLFEKRHMRGMGPMSGRNRITGFSPFGSLFRGAKFDKRTPIMGMGQKQGFRPYTTLGPTSVFGTIFGKRSSAFGVSKAAMDPNLLNDYLATMNGNGIFRKKDNGMNHYLGEGLEMDINDYNDALDQISGGYSWNTGNNWDEIVV